MRCLISSGGFVGFWGVFSYRRILKHFIFCEGKKYPQIPQTPHVKDFLPFKSISQEITA